MDRILNLSFLLGLIAGYFILPWLRAMIAARTAPKLAAA